MSVDSLPTLYTSEQVAEMLGVSDAHLQRMRYRGEGPVCIRVSHKAVRYRLADVEAWVDARAIR